MVRYTTRASSKLKEVKQIKEEVLEHPPPVAPIVEQDSSSFCLDEKLITCDVCLEILYGPINCGPCNHKFCAACIYHWLDTHNTCPKCRNVVKETTRDVFAAQICEEYLKRFPNRARSLDCKKEQDMMELEYLEKLIKRARYNREIRNYPSEDAERRDAESEQNLILYHSEIGGPLLAPRRLFLSNNRGFRENEWMTRTRRLREDMEMPHREWTPETENNERDEHNHRNFLHPHIAVRILGAGIGPEDIFGLFENEAERNPAIQRVAFLIGREQNDENPHVRRFGFGLRMRAPNVMRQNEARRARQEERARRTTARPPNHRYNLRTRRNRET